MGQLRMSSVLGYPFITSVGPSVRRDKDILVRQRCDLLLGLFIVCEGLLVLLPVLAGCAGHCDRIERESEK